jgi:hypothetical protein
MPKVILQISYDVQPSRREEYLRLVAEMRRHLTDVRKKNYAVYETKGKKNSFVEQFVCASVEEFEMLEDDLDEQSENFVNKLESLKEGKTRYTTLVEFE